MDYENILSNWINYNNSPEYKTYLTIINSFLSLLYFTDNRYDDNEKRYLNYIKYFYIKKNNIYAFYHMGIKSFLLKIDLNRDNFINNEEDYYLYNMNNIKYIEIFDENHLLQILNSLGLWSGSNRDEKINILLGIEKNEIEFKNLISFYEEHLIKNGYKKDEILNYFKKYKVTLN